MSQLGNIKNSYGKQFNMVIANTYGANILASYGLPSNSILASSPIDEDGIDIGTYALFGIDNNGTAARLTYTIKPGNGLINNGDDISLKIDNKTIKSNDNGLYIPLSELIDKKTINIDKNGKMSVNTQNLDIASDIQYGVFKIDDNTLKINSKTMFVETDNLQTASNFNLGIATSDNKTVTIQNGSVFVVTKNLKHSSEKTFGVSINDEKTIDSKYGQYSVNTQNLSLSTEKIYGISKPDNKTIKSDKGIYSVSTENLAISTNRSHGIVQINPNSLNIDNEGKMSVNKYSDSITKLMNAIKISDELDSKISSLTNVLKNYSGDPNKPKIYKFECNHITSAVLTRCVPGITPDEMYNEKISAEFTVNTNCPFYISLDFINNISPSIFLYELDYNRIDIYPGNRGLRKSFQSTQGKDVIIQLSFMCKNYSISDFHEYSRNTTIRVSCNYVNDNIIDEYVDFDIIRFNSMYNINNAADILDEYIKLTNQLENVISYITSDNSNVERLNIPEIDMGQIIFNPDPNSSHTFTATELESGIDLFNNVHLDTGGNYGYKVIQYNEKDDTSSIITQNTALSVNIDPNSYGFIVTTETNNDTGTINISFDGKDLYEIV